MGITDRYGIGWLFPYTPCGTNPLRVNRNRRTVEAGGFPKGAVLRPEPQEETAMSKIMENVAIVELGRLIQKRREAIGMTHAPPLPHGNCRTKPSE